MKKIILLITIITFFACNTKVKPKKPDFLLGEWIRLDDKPGVETFESWHKDFTGLGITLQEKDTTFKEILSIVSINDTLNLKVEGVNETPTLFKFTQQTDTSFVAENSKNEFPTIIKYWLENEQLNAHVSNDEFEITFVFNKLKVEF